jgi:outer membrane usher protein
VIVAFCLCPFSGALAQPTQAAAQASQRLVPLDVTVNGAKNGSWALLERGGTLFAPADAFAEWRINRTPTVQPIEYLGQSWYPLTSVPGYQAQMDFANQAVNLQFSPLAFAATRLGVEESGRPQLSTAEPALFLNFDFNLNQSRARDASSTRDLGALTELGFSNQWGYFTSSYVARNLGSHDVAQPSTVRRLESSFTRDFPGSNLSLRVGDSATRTGAWGRSVYFGGLQIGRNFGLSPGFITQPLPIISGVSTAPSTVELYINDALRQTSQVPAGPFAIDNFPLLTGNGQARMVVRDVLGRETVLVQDFFSHRDLLAKGLSDWSAEIGAVRQNLGTLNADYGERFGSALWRYGATEDVTAEGKAEVSRNTRGGGLGMTLALPAQLIGQFAAAYSQGSADGKGQHWLAGVEHTSLRHGFTMYAEGASRHYRQIGQEADMPSVRRQLSASYSYSSATLGSLGIAYAKVDSFDGKSIATYSLNHSIQVGQRSSLLFNAVRVQGGASGTSFGVSLLVPLERQVNMSSSLTHRSGQTDGYVSASQGLTSDAGLAWRALAGRRSGDSYAEGGVYYQGNKGVVNADVSASSSQQALRLGAQGGLVMMGGEVFSTRRVDGSFALVEVPGYANVGVGFQGSVLARTNAQGKTLVTQLVPYQTNSIRLDPAELPISAELDSIELTVVPPGRSGVKVTFPVRSGRGALIKIVFDDGEPAPPGAELELVGDKQPFFVARRGEAFVTGLQPSNSLRLKWGTGQCAFTVVLPPGNPDDISRVGPVMCSGVRR